MTRNLSAALLIAGFSSFALAQSLPPFEEVDQNQDGQISPAEAAAIEGLDFVVADTDESGALTPEEYEAARQQ